MSKIFIVYSHYDEKAFNSAIKDTFINKAKENGPITVDLVDLYKKKNLILYFLDKNQTM